MLTNLQIMTVCALKRQPILLVFQIKAECLFKQIGIELSHAFSIYYLEINIFNFQFIILLYIVAKFETYYMHIF